MLFPALSVSMDGTVSLLTVRLRYHWKPCQWSWVRFHAMSPVVRALLAFLAACFRSRRSMQLEILALRHQLSVYQRSVPRPRIQPMDRLLWSWLAHLWAGWQDALAFV